MGRFAAIAVQSVAGDYNGSVDFVCYNKNSIYASINPEPANTQVYLNGIKITSSLKKLTLNNSTLRYAIKKPTKGESTTITYYADKDGKLPLNTTIITCM